MVNYFKPVVTKIAFSTASHDRKSLGKAFIRIPLRKRHLKEEMLFGVDI